MLSNDYHFCYHSLRFCTSQLRVIDSDSQLQIQTLFYKYLQLKVLRVLTNQFYPKKLLAVSFGFKKHILYQFEYSYFLRVLYKMDKYYSVLLLCLYIGCKIYVCREEELVEP